MKGAYYYLFYKLYKFGEWSPSSFPGDFTATFTIAVFETMFLACLKFYYIEFVNHNDVFSLTSFQTIVSLLAIFLINYFAFLRDAKWKDYVKSFDKLPKYKNIIGTWVVIGTLAFIIINVAISFHLMGQIAANRNKFK